MEITALQLARRFEGVHERKGPNAHPFVLWCLQRGDPSIVDDETAWCSAFAAAICFMLGLPEPARVNRLRARRWLEIGQSVALADARPGFDLVVFKRGGADQPGPEVLDAQGHVAFFVSQGVSALSGRSIVRAFGGNQADSVSEAAFLAEYVLDVRRLLPTP